MGIVEQIVGQNYTVDEMASWRLLDDVGSTLFFICDTRDRLHPMLSPIFIFYPSFPLPGWGALATTTLTILLTNTLYIKIQSSIQVIATLVW